MTIPQPSISIKLDSMLWFLLPSFQQSILASFSHLIPSSFALLITSLQPLFLPSVSFVPASASFILHLFSLIHASFEAPHLCVFALLALFITFELMLKPQLTSSSAQLLPSFFCQPLLLLYSLLRVWLCVKPQLSLQPRLLLQLCVLLRAQPISLLLLLWLAPLSIVAAQLLYGAFPELVLALAPLTVPLLQALLFFGLPLQPWLQLGLARVRSSLCVIFPRVQLAWQQRRFQWLSFEQAKIIQPFCEQLPCQPPLCELRP